MPERKKKIMTPGGEWEGTSVSINSSQENFNTYLLEDGTVLKFKTVLVDVIRVDGKYDDDGNPLYVTRTKNIVTADSPEELRRREG
ncbi:MAG: hypothetical protein L0323_16365 [Planctomycetes bacterium]|nr:hypothetical protein [Planctomycetota bacterium]